MNNTTHKTEIALCIDPFVLKMGIQYIIRQLGIDASYHYINHIDDLATLRCRYLIIHHKFLEKPKMVHLHTIQKTFKGKILIIGNDKINAQHQSEFLLSPNENEKVSIEKISRFFSEITPACESGDNDLLSSREIDILKKVALGYSNKEIADHLFISINTVITHRKNVTEKLGIKTISGLTVYALMNNLIEADDVKS